MLVPSIPDPWMPRRYGGTPQSKWLSDQILRYGADLVENPRLPTVVGVRPGQRPVIEVHPDADIFTAHTWISRALWRVINPSWAPEFEKLRRHEPDLADVIPLPILRRPW